MKTGHNYYVYIIQCSDDSYYTGLTNDLERRLWEHETGYNEKCYTFTRRPVVLKYYELFRNVNNAIAWEKQLKGWSRKKKEALFKEDWKEISKLAKSRLRQAQPDKTPKDQSNIL
ncbi:MAG TPA: GIY-YIG nuclease family protein [Chitinophagaceae bacterium]|nr:GIY-YIG nuclease family protein [Chitinophagaceae bacterium]